MKFLNFTTEAPEFRIEGEDLVWAISNRSLEGNITEFALSSCLFHFSTTKGKQLPMVLTCSLVDEDFENYDGTICVGVSEFKNFHFQSANLEFWRLDCSRPRKIVFALRGVSANTIKFANITLALR